MLTQTETMERLFDLDWQLIADSVLTLIAVAVLCLALSYFLMNPIRKILSDRTERIAQDLAKTKADLESADAMRAEYEEKLAVADKAAEEILTQARKRAAQTEAQLLSKAKEEAQRILSHAQAEAELEKQKVKDEVKREMVLVASLMAGKMVQVTMDQEKQNQFVEEALLELGEGTWLN
jgi:F-type H+-transporting ATPase subunit b